MPRGDTLLHDAMVFEIGTYFHVLFQNLCERAGYLVKREVAIKNSELRILGHGDGVLSIKGHKYLLEIKTCNSRTFIGLNQPKEEHKKQITAYMKALNLRWAIVIYMDKDRQGLKEFVVQYQDSYWRKEVAPRIETYFNALRTNKLPEQEGFSPSKFPCAYCEFTRICYDPMASRKWLKGLPK